MVYRMMKNMIKEMNSIRSLYIRRGVKQMYVIGFVVGFVSCTLCFGFYDTWKKGKK